ncbi:YwqG family protein [Streptomyces sp. NPDC058953]|uniref:YwqG family protein n=1 Tax=unclassified Streptomyces TaxID=2593676 RepID=UPI0036C81A80
MAQGTPEILRDLAHRHLSSDDAERWLGLLRPAARLLPARPGDPVAARLGGIPELPAGWAWPVWEGHGPLSFIASADCSALPREALDVDVPKDGTLLFFYFDGQLDDGSAVVLPEYPDTRPGSRLLYVPAGEPVLPRGTPEGLDPYPVVDLAARPTMTSAEPWHPDLRDAFSPGSPAWQRYDHPVCGEDFDEALWDTEEDEGPAHRIGGHPHSIQNPVELEAAATALGGGDAGAVDRRDPRLTAESADWVLLAQFDSDDDADMMWGDAGLLYWLIHRDDLAARRFDKAVFTWQCG